MRTVSGAFLLEQEISYSYDQPIYNLLHRLVVIPRFVHGIHRRKSFGVSISDDTANVRLTTDVFSNCVVKVSASSLTTTIDFHTWAVVTKRGHGTVTESNQILDTRQLLQPTRLTRPGPVLTSVGEDLREASRNPLEIAEMASSWTGRAMRYKFGATNVQTTAEEALTIGQGVCQDYAHIMLGICRSAGVPARYVSGHLVGEGGSHAWVEVLEQAPCGSGWIAFGFDPTHSRHVDHRYLAVAVGRDYADVAPTSGRFSGAGRSSLKVRKRLSEIEDEKLAGLRLAGFVR